jgi:hypothetical protein
MSDLTTPVMPEREWPCSPKSSDRGVRARPFNALREITWFLERRYGWSFDLDQIADQLGIGAPQSVAVLPPSEYLFQTVFPWLSACRPIASYRHPLRFSAGCRESTWLVETISG